MRMGFGVLRNNSELLGLRPFSSTRNYSALDLRESLRVRAGCGLEAGALQGKPTGQWPPHFQAPDRVRARPRRGPLDRGQLFLERLGGPEGGGGGGG